MKRATSAKEIKQPAALREETAAECRELSASLERYERLASTYREMLDRAEDGAR